MPIPEFLLERIKTSAMSGEQVADAFAKLAQVMDRRDLGDCAVNLEYVREADQLLPSDLIPTVTFSLIRCRDVTDQTKSDCE